jgi:hypothetical protein
MNKISPLNPASGLPMIDDSLGSVDIAGNPYGTDLNSHDPFDHCSSSFDRSSSFSSSDWSSSFGTSWD